MESKLEKLKQKVMTGRVMNLTPQLLIPSLPSSFYILTESPLAAASLRKPTLPDILQTLPETRAAGFRRFSLMLWSYASERNGEVITADSSRSHGSRKCPKLPRTGDGRREAFSPLAFLDRPTEVREVLALQHFIDGVRDPEIQESLSGLVDLTT
ncbi:hypothetical protein TNCV_1412281 [Trichonephila clavipes]|nr:hypothetical protein TNCV_1412281 [Trichonephila clavipes]